MMRSQFMLLALLLGAWLLGLFLQYRLKRRQREARREVDSKAPPVLPRKSTPLPPRVTSPRVSPRPALAPLVATHKRLPSRLGSPREVRRGIVLMTILGPCRALEPPECPQ